MKVTVLNGASGVGKSTVLRRLLPKLPGRGAILDGDDVSRVHPFVCSTGWLNLVQDNLLCCAENLAASDVSHLAIAFVFPSQERVDRLNRLFATRGLDLCWIGLVAGDACLETRLKRRGVVKEEIFSTAREFNRAVKELAEHRLIDTTAMEPDEVVEQIVAWMPREPVV